MSRETLELNVLDFKKIAKSLSNQVRIDILELIRSEELNINEIASRLGIPLSTATVNVQKLEESGLIYSKLQPGIRGSQKICYLNYEKIILNFIDKKNNEKKENTKYISMPIGNFVECKVQPTCGILSEKGPIGFYDDVKSFYLPERVHAQLIWIGSGYLKYHFPNDIPYGAGLESMELSTEICSESTLSNESIPSDITLWVNDIEVGTWTSPASSTNKRGKLTPSWWEDHNRQYGILKCWKVDKTGSFIDGIKISDASIEKLALLENPFISIKIGIKETAKNKGGLNLFGGKFGNYEEDLLLRLSYNFNKSNDKKLR